MMSTAFRRTLITLVIALLASMPIACFSGGQIGGNYERLKFQDVLVQLPGAFGSGFLQDRTGFFWLGLQAGLGKWDGETLRVFDTRNSGLSSVAITGLLEDGEGFIWIATQGGGVNRYDPNTKTFDVFRHERNDPASLQSDTLGSVYYKQALAEDGQGNIWIASFAAGVSRFVRAEQRFKRYQNKPGEAPLLPDDRVVSVYADRAGQVWAGTQSGLARYDREQDRFVRVSIPWKRDVQPVVRSMHEGREGVLWLGTEGDGLLRFDTVSGTAEQYLPQRGDRNSLAAPLISAIAIDRNGFLWLPHYEKQLSIFDPENERFYRHVGDDNSPGRLHGSELSDAYADRDGRVWLLSHTGVLNKYDQNAYKFELYRHDDDDAFSLPQNSIRRTFLDLKGNVWFDAGNNGLLRYDSRLDGFRQFFLPSKGFSTFLEDRSGTYWVGGFVPDGSRSALLVLDPERMQFTKSFPLPRGTFSVGMIEDALDPDVLWFGTTQAGLGRFNKRTGDFSFQSHDPAKPTTISPGSIWRLERDSDDPAVLWLAVDGGGVNRFDVRSGEFKRYIHAKDRPDGIAGNSVFSFVQTRAGEFWVMVKGQGLQRFDKQRERFELFSETNGRFPDDKMVNVVEDLSGILWLNGPGGRIVRFDPRNGESRVFGRDDGVQTGAAWSGGAAVGPDGRIWFAGGQGVNAFYPEQVKLLHTEPPVVFTALMQGDEPMSLGRAPELVKELKLDWKNNFFEFSYAALDYTHPEFNKYQYILEGWDKDWYLAGTRNHGRYSNLAGGEYVLRVRGTNSEGDWSPHEAVLRVSVTPPFWEALWFRALLGLLGAFAVVLIVMWRTARVRAYNRRLRERQDELEARVAERTEELRLAMRKLVQSEKLAALGHLVAGISHEMNTPLGNARVMGALLAERFTELSREFSEGMLKRSNMERFVSQGLESIAILERSIVRAIDLVSRFQQVAVDQGGVRSRSRFVLYEVVNDLFVALGEQLRQPPCRVVIDIDSSIVMTSYPDALEQVLSILVSNAVVHGFEGQTSGEIRVQGRVCAPSNVELVFSNNGHGIPEESLQRVFEPFFTTKLGQGSSGLGLYVAYNLATSVLGGTIEVENLAEQGCKFVLRLPLSAGDESEKRGLAEPGS